MEAGQTTEVVSPQSTWPAVVKLLTILAAVTVMSVGIYALGSDLAATPPPVSTVTAADFGQPEDANLILWFWAPW